MRIKFIALIFIFTSIVSYPMVIQPFGPYGNISLVKEDMTALFKVVPFADIEISQNLLNIDNLNAFLNEEEIVIDKDAMSAVVNEGLNIFVNANMGMYGHFNLFGFRLIPYAKIDGNIGIKIPKTFSSLLFDETKTGQTYEDEVQEFLKANIVMNVGGAVVLGPLYIGANLYSPVAISDKDHTIASASYTSSASPAYAELNVSANARLLSSYLLTDINYAIDTLINDAKNALETGSIDSFIQNYAGVSLDFGLGWDNFGIAIKNFVILPAKATYAIGVAADGKIVYTGDGTNITYDATYNFAEPSVSYLIEPAEAIPPMQISAYLKGGSFLMWGIAGSYWMDGNWMAKGFAGFNLGITKIYYMLGMNSAGYSHTLGLGVNLFFVNADLKLTATTNQIIPVGQTTPGVGVALTLSGGL
jgi:hypothetical protein